MKGAKLIVSMVFLTAGLVASGSALATGYPWRNHALPFDFLFGNDFDMHQQSKLLDNGELQGFQYIKFTGAFTSEGYPIAIHGQVTVGWDMYGVPGTATLCASGPHHPTWRVDPREVPREPGYVHFHWIGGPLTPGDIGATFPGFFLKHTALDTFYFPEHETLVAPGIDYNFAPNIVTACP